MMTGRLPVRVGIGIPNSQYAPHAPGPSAGGNLVLTAEAIGGLPLNETTLAEQLETVGYTSGMCGKWQCVDVPIAIDLKMLVAFKIVIPLGMVLGVQST